MHVSYISRTYISAYPHCFRRGCSQHARSIVFVAQQRKRRVKCHVCCARCARCVLVSNIHCTTSISLAHIFIFIALSVSLRCYRQEGSASFRVIVSCCALSLSHHLTQYSVSVPGSYNVSAHLLPFPTPCSWCLMLDALSHQDLLLDVSSEGCICA